MKEIKGSFYERSRVESAWQEVCKRYAEETLKQAYWNIINHIDCYPFEKTKVQIQDSISNIIKELK